MELCSSEESHWCQGMLRARAAALLHSLKVGMSHSAPLWLFSLHSFSTTLCSSRRGENAHTVIAWRADKCKVKDYGRRDFLHGETLGVWASSNPRPLQRQSIKNNPPCLFLASSISKYILLDKTEAFVLVAFLWEMERSGTEQAVFRL